jgi:hypothetical protein
LGNRPALSFAYSAGGAHSDRIGFLDFWYSHTWSHRGLVMQNDRGRTARSDKGLHMNASRRLLATMVVVAAVLLISSIASANRLAFSALTFRITSGAGIREGDVICPLTLEGSFHSNTFAKVPGSLIGYITRAALEEELCSGGTARYLRETLPWHLRYAGFAGLLPNITSITTMVIGLGILLRRGIESCLYRTSLETPGVLTWFREEAGAIRAIRWSERENIRSNTRTLFCETQPASLIGFSERVTQLESTELISLRLI